jgi:hypothetical protein
LQKSATHMFLILVSTADHNGIILRQVPHATLKLYGHESTIHPDITCYR